MSTSYPATFGELETAWFNLLLTNSTAYAHWDADRRRVLLNEGMFETFLELIDVYEEEHFLVESDQFQVASGGAIDFNSFPNYYRGHSLEKLAGTNWIPIRIFSAGENWRSQVSGESEPWVQSGQKLRSPMNPSGTYRLLYFRMPAEMAQAGDPIDLPKQYAMLPAYRAAMTAAAQERQQADYNAMRDLFAGGVAKMKRTAGKRFLSKMWRVADTEGYGHDGLNPPIMFTE